MPTILNALAFMHDADTWATVPFQFTHIFPRYQLNYFHLRFHRWKKHRAMFVQATQNLSLGFSLHEPNRFCASAVKIYGNLWFPCRLKYAPNCMEWSHFSLYDDIFQSSSYLRTNENIDSDGCFFVSAGSLHCSNPGCLFFAGAKAKNSRVAESTWILCAGLPFAK